MRTLLLTIACLSFSIAASAKELPADYQALDINGNGEIDVQEVEVVIDEFFAQNKGYTVLFVHELIDFFFDQV